MAAASEPTGHRDNEKAVRRAGPTHGKGIPRAVSADGALERHMLTHVMMVAGEASGDQHAAGVARELSARIPQLRLFGMGGPALAAAGVDLLYGAHEVSVMGLTEVLPKVPRILEVMRGLARAAARRRPSLAILVDIPDFNLRLAKSLKALGIPVVYYISPMVWATRPGRVKTIRQVVDKMLCILPFEERFYRGTGVDARYVGSPVVEQLPAPAPAAHFRRSLGLPLDRPMLALLPGSRQMELRRLLPVMAETARRQVAQRPGLQVVIPVAPGLTTQEVLQPFGSQPDWLHLIEGRAPEVVGASDVAVVASGTAALEAGLMQRPLAVIYRVSGLTYWAARTLIQVPYISLVNLLLDRPLVPELIQTGLSVDALCKALEPLWAGPARDQMVQGLVELRQVLGPPGAAARAADEALELLRSRPLLTSGA